MEKIYELFKEFHFVFTEQGRKGIQCWTEANFDQPKRCIVPSSNLIAHSPQSGLVLDIESDQFTAVDLRMEVFFYNNPINYYNHWFDTILIEYIIIFRLIFIANIFDL